MKLNFNKLSLFNINKERIKKWYHALAYHAFSIMLILILLSILFGILLFYYYVVLVQARPQEISAGTVKFEYSKYQNILKARVIKEQTFQEFNDANTTNPFK